MKTWAALLLLPPLVFVFPWSVAAWRRQWLRAGLLLAVWVAAWAVLLTLWFGPGIAVLLALGLWMAFTTVIEIPVSAPP